MGGYSNWNVFDPTGFHAHYAASSMQHADEAGPSGPQAEHRSAPAPMRGALEELNSLRSALPQAEAPPQAGHLARPPRNRSALSCLGSLLSRDDPSRPSQTVSKAVAALQEIKVRFEGLLQANWEPGDVEDFIDAVVLPTLVAAERARQPGMPLDLIDSPKDLRKWLKTEGSPLGKRAILALPGYENHFVAADVRHVDGRISLLIVDALGINKPDRVARYKSAVLPELRKLMPSNGVATLFCLGTQKAQTGCRIFSLSAASKLADHRMHLNELHRLHHRDVPFKTSAGEMVDAVAMVSGVRMLDGTGLLPKEFFKHSQSSGTLRQWAAANRPGEAGEAVNKLGETLSERYQRHVTERHPSPFSILAMDRQGLRGQVDPALIAPIRSSNSLEEKRLVYLQRAIDYLQVAPKDESRALLKRLQRFHLKPGDIPAPDLRNLRWGPHPNTLL